MCALGEGACSWRVVFLLAVLATLAGCAAPRVKSDRAHLATQSAREQMLADRDNWSLDGRLAVSDGHDGGSGTLEWSNTGTMFRFSLHAPVTGKTWVLKGDDRHAVLSGLRAQPMEGDNAARLLESALGWHVPVSELTDWVRGLRAPGPATIVFRADGLPAQIDQAGWKVEYRDYDTNRVPALPKRIFASHGDYRVRLAVRHWKMP